MEAVVGIDFTTCAVEVSHRPFGGLFGVCGCWVVEEDCAGVDIGFVETFELCDCGCLIEPFERGCRWCRLETFERLGGGRCVRSLRTWLQTEQAATVGAVSMVGARSTVGARRNPL